MGKHYVISDIHGCYNEYQEALHAIRFSDEDTLYVLGDSIDRGYATVKVLKDMMMRPNVFPFLGDHEWMAMDVLKELHKNRKITIENFRRQLSRPMVRAFEQWANPRNGGQTTVKEFCALDDEEQEDILDYLEEFLVYAEVSAGGRDYLLVHGGMEPFRKGNTPDDYTVEELVWSRVDYSRPYYTDKFTITGHTPTICEMGNSGQVIRRNNHIAIDCGCVYGANLAVYCMETDEVLYIPYRGE